MSPGDKIITRARDSGKDHQQFVFKLEDGGIELDTVSITVKLPKVFK